MMPWIILFGFVGTLYVVTWLILTLSGGSFLTLIGVTVTFVLVVWGALVRERLAAVRAFRKAFPDKDLLIVLTDSPHWQPYIEEHWLPRWGERAVVFNRSRPWISSQPEARLWNALKGVREHTPLVVVVRPGKAPRVIRFFMAFRDFKHGKEGLLRAREKELPLALEE
jgi:hypothetical protein